MGEGTDLVALWWSDMPTPPAGGAALIQGTGGYFAVRNVTIFAQAQFPDIISDAGFDGMQASGCQGTRLREVENSRVHSRLRR